MVRSSTAERHRNAKKKTRRLKHLAYQRAGCRFDSGRTNNTGDIPPRTLGQVEIIDARIEP